jgi:predicted RNA-binding Zn ribbon-like protein
MDLAFEFINSEEWYGRRPRGQVDHLERSEWLAEFLETWGFTDIGAPNSAQRRQLLRLRDLLRRMVTALASGEVPSMSDLEELDRFLGGCAIRRHVTYADGEFQVQLAPERRDWTWLLSEIASSFVEVLVEGERERVKLCENAECQWAFYDTTKNRRRRWCDPAECGNLFKVRQFRARRRAGRSAR